MMARTEGLFAAALRKESSRRASLCLFGLFKSVCKCAYYVGMHRFGGIET
jgi:hypothetical protein